MIRIEVISKDRVGLVSAISGAIYASGADIRSHKAKVYSDIAGKPISKFIAEIDVGDNIRPEEIIRRIYKIKGVLSAEVK